MREGEIKEEGEQTQVGEILGDFQRGHFKLLHPRTGMGGKGQEGQAIHLSLQFSFFCLSFIRIGPMLLLSSVALTLWAAMGWGGVVRASLTAVPPGKNWSGPLPFNLYCA